MSHHVGTGDSASNESTECHPAALVQSGVTTRDTGTVFHGGLLQVNVVGKDNGAILPDAVGSDKLPRSA
jgi:hypothetical protein